MDVLKSNLYLYTRSMVSADRLFPSVAQSVRFEQLTSYAKVNGTKYQDQRRDDAIHQRDGENQ